MKVILSRTDNLGDVILTLPMAGWLKKQIPGVQIVFLGKGYTKPIISRSEFIDGFLNWDELKNDSEKAVSVLKSVGADAIVHVFPDPVISRVAKKAAIPLRIATTGRFYSWFYSNKLLAISRRRSDLHEAQLNLRMLTPFNIPVDVSLKEVGQLYGFQHVIHQPSPVMRLILHPKSKGSAREWGLENYTRLIELLPPEKVGIFVTGTKEEGDLMRDFLNKNGDRITDMTGKLSLDELIDFIGSCDAMVAASTGPLHIAAALGKKVIGLYSPMRPIFPARWAPLGENAIFLVKDKKCSDCRKTGDCHCIRELRAEEIVGEILKNEE